MSTATKICIACAALIILICAVALIVKHRRKNTPKHSDVGKIMKTTDGYFNNRQDIKKERNVAVVAQRKDDGAVAVVKVRSEKEGRQNTSIKGVTLKPDKHPALTENSLVEKNLRVSRTDNGVKKALQPRDMTDTGDKLTRGERHKIMRGLKGPTKDNKVKTTQKIKSWRKHFKK
ncbi:MAG: hypothetical protein NC311_12375 [Muribaculaceae bacterium]|nr:hypothetical protein [Muribaculaceae bacterium]